jgi:hypothetical protein
MDISKEDSHSMVSRLKTISRISASGTLQDFSNPDPHLVSKAVFDWWWVEKGYRSKVLLSDRARDPVPVAEEDEGAGDQGLCSSGSVFPCSSIPTSLSRARKRLGGCGPHDSSTSGSTQTWFNLISPAPLLRPDRLSIGVLLKSLQKSLAVRCWQPYPSSLSHHRLLCSSSLVGAFEATTASSVVMGLHLLSTHAR